jgi:hypothetical protein
MRLASFTRRFPRDEHPVGSWLSRNLLELLYSPSAAAKDRRRFIVPNEACKMLAERGYKRWHLRRELIRPVDGPLPKSCDVFCVPVQRAEGAAVS